MSTPGPASHPRSGTVTASVACSPAHDPLHALWVASGQPAPSAPMDRAGDCARCQAPTDQASRVKAVVSDKFTGWDQYTHTPDPLWCPACAWGHTTTALRTRAWLIGPTHAGPADRDLLRTTLMRPLAEDTAVVVPLSRQKHLLPFARWGHVSVDDRTLRWGTRETSRLDTVARLRVLGFSEAALRQPVPRFEQLITLAPETIGGVLADWDTLAPWRADDTYIQLAIIATRT